MEVWKDIPGYEGHYQVSNIGNVKGLDRYIKHPRGGLKYQKGTFKPMSKDLHGYCLVRLVKDKKGKTFRVHRLVLLAFIGESSLLIDHINNIPWDNRLENLEYVTHRENSHRYKKMVSNKIIGVYRKGDKYRASICVKGIKHNLGTYDTAEKAKEVYNKVLNGESIEKYKFKRKRQQTPKGIYFRPDTKNYSVRITINGKYTTLGSRQTVEEAQELIKTYKFKISELKTSNL